MPILQPFEPAFRTATLAALLLVAAVPACGGGAPTNGALAARLTSFSGQPPMTLHGPEVRG